MKVRRLALILGFLAAACPFPLAAQPDFPLTLTDASGFRLTLPSAPKAMISLTLTSDELLAHLVDKSRFKAIEIFAADPGISNVADFARTIPVRISAEKEKIIALQPDLVFLADWKEKDFVQALRDAKVPVLVFKTPDSIDSLKALISQMAAAVGEGPKGKELLVSLDQRLNAVAAKLSSVPRAGRLTVLSYGFSGSTYGKGTSFDDLAERAGLVNAAAKAGLSGWPLLSKEKVLELDPDVVVLPDWSYDGKDSPARFLAAFLQDPVFAGLKAVRNKKVFMMPDRHLQATSQFMVDGVEDLARAAYPERFR